MTYRTRILLATFSVAVLASAIVGVSRSDDDTYLEEISEWRGKRVERLKSPNYYLGLTGLYWIKDGKTTFGSDPSNDVVFPSDKAPKSIGAFFLKDGEVKVEVKEGAGVMHEEKAVSEMVLHHDADPDHDRTELKLGTMTWYAIKRGDKFGIRLRDSDSPALRAFHGVDFFPPDTEWLIRGVFEKYDPVKYIPITSVGDIETNEVSSGAIVFEVDGKTHRLDVLADPGDESLFVIFGDETAGYETYGGGRFVYVDAPVDDSGEIVIDFNKAYNPPCAFSDYTTCPLPPRQNQLPIRVTAGEKVYKKEKS